MAFIIILIYLVTILWVAIDSSKRDWSENKYWRSTIAWVISCFVLWIVYFPTYLFARKKAPIKKIDPMPVIVTSSDHLDRLHKLTILRDSGTLTEDEFTQQKMIILDESMSSEEHKKALSEL
jgi:hypothetical protein